MTFRLTMRWHALFEAERPWPWPSAGKREVEVLESGPGLAGGLKRNPYKPGAKLRVVIAKVVPQTPVKGHVQAEPAGQKLEEASVILFGAQEHESALANLLLPRRAGCYSNA